jgi:riboflavin synthase
MFTGIIAAMGTVAKVDRTRGDVRFVIETPWIMDTVDMGASIACSGCCLTVVEKGGTHFTVDVSAETLSKTNLGEWDIGTKINLERSLRLGDELGGHIVSGHVDGLAVLESIAPEGDSYRLKIRVPDHLKLFIAPKGSVALDGISLTVNEVEDTVFGVNIIPHTWNVTTLGQRKAGDNLNLEADLLARYAARILGK